jgi:FKBP-type peptidyl-prolyl cis-trans isomerase
MVKYILGLIVIILIAAGGYWAYQNYGTMNTGAQNQQTDTVQAQDVTVGTGTTAEPGSVVSILYVGRLSDGTIFDSSEAHGNQPLIFQLGAPGIIAGFQIGVNGMKEGGERRMVVPSALGYGGEDVKDPTTGAVIIPANSTLVFDVKLVKVEPAPAGTSTPAAQ